LQVGQTPVLVECFGGGVSDLPRDFFTGENVFVLVSYVTGGGSPSQSMLAVGVIAVSPLYLLRILPACGLVGTFFLLTGSHPVPGWSTPF
jgi:hypothetical protein